MAKAHQALPRAEAKTLRCGDLLRDVRSYLSERFPISQAGAVVSSYSCCYLLYGQAQGHHVFGWTAIAGAITVVLLALVRRSSIASKISERISHSSMAVVVGCAD